MASRNGHLPSFLWREEPIPCHDNTPFLSFHSQICLSFPNSIYPIIVWFLILGYSNYYHSLSIMETELKSMNPDPPKPEQPYTSSRDEGSYSKDDRPLLKSEPNRVNSATTEKNIEELEKKFAAFVRSDVYGPMGRGELPLVEKVLSAIAVVTLFPIRFVLALVILVVYYVICRVCTLFSAPNRDEEEEQEDFAHMGGWRRAVIVWCGRFLSRLLLFVLGFYWICESYRDIELPNQIKSSSQVYIFIAAAALRYVSVFLGASVNNDLIMIVVVSLFMLWCWCFLLCLDSVSLNFFFIQD